MKPKHMAKLLMVMLLAALVMTPVMSQDQTVPGENQVRILSIVIKNDGTEFIGYIISQDEREVLIETQNMGRVVIPKHEIREIKEVTQRDMRDGVYVGSNIFSSRYFFTTNGLSLKKGENYALINLYGPEAHFCLANNFTVGALTTWIGVPLVASLKYSIPVTDYLAFGIGVLGGTLSWLDFGAVGGLAYGSVTFGDHNNNLTLSGGYAGVRNQEDVSGSDPLFSVAGMVRLGKNVSLVGDSFIYAGADPVFIIMPGLRFSRTESKAFQFGLAGVVYQGEAIPFPIPVIGWFLKI